jgi:hypothetical protein
MLLRYLAIFEFASRKLPQVGEFGGRFPLGNEDLA